MLHTHIVRVSVSVTTHQQQQQKRVVVVLYFCFCFSPVTLVTSAADRISLLSRESFVNAVHGKTIGTDMLTRLGGRCVGSASNAVSISLNEW